MNRHELIEKLIRDTIHRAARESIACVIVIVAFSFQLAIAVPGSARFFGTLLILIGTGFIAGVLWSFTLSYRLLRIHPASDSLFWQEAFRAQAQLLRLVPLWYCAPICTGVVLTVPGEFPIILIGFATVGLVFGGVTWLNRYAAAQLDEQARAFAPESSATAN
jgi:hypothetical protein